MSQTVKERIALGSSAGILIAAVWFWIIQIGNVLETLSLSGA
ncbi:MAG: hypothetical protein R3E82_08210 [Pseudomonadales bacterium]